MHIAAIDNSTIPTSGAISQQNDAALKEEFLLLLVTQLQNQDPLNPQDPADFTAQLATFSNLEQLVKVNQKLSDQTALQAVSIGTAAASFVGQQGEVASDHLTVQDGQIDTARYLQRLDSATTTINIYDESDNLVRTIDLGAQDAGQHDVVWDGLNNEGLEAGDGSYRFEVVAETAAGDSISTTTSIVGRITGVQFENGIVLLKIGDQHFTLSELLGIGESA